MNDMVAILRDKESEICRGVDAKHPTQGSQVFRRRLVSKFRLVAIIFHRRFFLLSCPITSMEMRLSCGGNDALSNRQTNARRSRYRFRSLARMATAVTGSLELRIRQCRCSNRSFSRKVCRTPSTLWPLTDRQLYTNSTKKPITRQNSTLCSEILSRDAYW